MNRYRHQPKRVCRASDPPKAPRGHQGVSAFAIVLVLLWAGSVSALKSDPVQVSARGNILQAHLDFHAASGNLFAVILNEESGFSNWLVNISTDGGATWTETYTWQSTMVIEDISSVVAGGYLYVAYVDPLAPESGKIRRFSAIDGAVDSTFGGSGWLEVLNAAPDHFSEVALASSADQNDTRLYYFAVQSDYVLRYAWTNQEGGAGTTPWSEIATGVTTANHSLEATYAENSSTFVYVAYEDLDGNLHVWRRMSTVTSDVTDLGVTPQDWIRISAFEDTVVVIYDSQIAADRGIDYVVSTDAGETWDSASLTPLDNYTSPAVTLRNGGGIAAVYHNVTTPDWAALTQKDYSSGEWSTPIDCALPGLTTGSFTDIERLPFGDYGVLLVGSGTSSRNAFFALPLLVFGDGFEAGDDSQWSETLPLR